jgi:hypothetical protein
MVGLRVRLSASGEFGALKPAREVGPHYPVELTAHSADFVAVRGSMPVGRSSPEAFGSVIEVTHHNPRDFHTD